MPMNERFPELLLQKALAEGATQLHLEPQTDRRWRIRIRRGDEPSDPLTRLHWGEPLSSDLGKQVVAWLKSRAECDPLERRLPQSGRLRIDYDQVEYSATVSTLPCRRGEVVTVELGLPSAPPLEELGLGPCDLARVRRALTGSARLVLVASDRNSGTRSLLRSFATYLAAEQRTVYSIAAGEPDLKLDGIVQVEVRPELHFDRANALRATLRNCDPDAIRLDSLDSHELVQLALAAAARGITVVTSIPGADTAHAVVRLLHMLDEPRLLAETLSLVVAARLPRRLCPSCSDWGPAPSRATLRRTVPRLTAERLLSGWQRARAPGHGCEFCRGGYRDRVPVFEVLEPTAAILDRVVDAKDTEGKLGTLRERTRGLREAAMLLAESGATSVLEALRITPPAAEAPLGVGKPERANALA